MEWTSDVAAGSWIDDRLDHGERWGTTMHGVVPRGFAAYARILHPAQRDDKTVRWSDAAAAFGTRLHPTAQWHRIVRASGHPGQWQEVTAPDGSVFHAPEEGSLDPALVTAVARHLATATSTPDDTYVAVWEGWGGLLGFYGETPSRTFFTIGDPEASDVGSGAASGDAAVADAALQDHHRQMLERSIHDPFNNVFRKPTWQAGILPDDVSQGARLSLPSRDHVLFHGSANELARPDWVLSVPWRDREAESHGFAPDAHSPSIVWPADRAWVMVTEVDYDSTVVGGDPALIEAIVADPALEAFVVPAEADLSWEGDAINS
jgi:hypothetical protein